VHLVGFIIRTLSSITQKVVVAQNLCTGGYWFKSWLGYWLS